MTTVRRASEARAASHFASTGRRPSTGPPKLLAAPPELSPAGSTAVYWVGATSSDGSALPCTGIQGTSDVLDLASAIPETGVVAAWVAIELSNGWWAQVGYFTDVAATDAFYQVWDLGDEGAGPITTGMQPVSTGYHSFSLRLVSGTTWGFYVDGVEIGSYDLQASVSAGPLASQPAEALVEQQLGGGDAFSIPDIESTTALQVVQADGWQDVVTADALVIGPYGVQGQMQAPALAADATIVGSSIPLVSTGVLLWSGQTEATTLTAVFHSL